MNVAKTEGGFRASFGGQWLPKVFKTRGEAQTALAKLKRKKVKGKKVKGR